MLLYKESSFWGYIKSLDKILRNILFLRHNIHKMEWEFYVTAVELCARSRKCYVTNTLSHCMEEEKNKGKVKYKSEVTSILRTSLVNAGHPQTYEHQPILLSILMTKLQA